MFISCIESQRNIKIDSSFDDPCMQNLCIKTVSKIRYNLLSNELYFVYQPENPTGREILPWHKSAEKARIFLKKGLFITHPVMSAILYNFEEKLALTLDIFLYLPDSHVNKNIFHNCLVLC